MNLDNRVVLALMAHPDDGELVMGGTLARLANSGFKVHLMVSCIPDFREIRIKEAEEGGRILGVKLHWLDHPGTWQVEDLPVYKLVSAYDAIIRELNPGTIFTQWIHDTHYDHVLVARAAFSACRNRDIDIYMGDQPNMYAPSSRPFESTLYVDVSDFMESRLKAIRIHHSQVVGKNYEEHVLSRARFHGNRIGCKYAETFTTAMHRLRL